jgi:hypothetical protein
MSFLPLLVLSPTIAAQGSQKKITDYKKLLVTTPTTAEKQRNNKSGRLKCNEK